MAVMRTPKDVPHEFIKACKDELAALNLCINLSNLSDEEAVQQIYLATLARFPSGDEMTASLASKGTNQRFVWLPRLQWALVNKLDFIFNN